MRDSERQQIVDACDGLKSAAELMRFLMHVKKMKEREYPEDKPDSPRLWVEMTTSRMASKVGYSRAQVCRALSLLTRRGFVSAQHRRGEPCVYQINSHLIQKWLQPMELFEQEYAENLPHDDTGTCLMMRQVPASSRYRYLPHGETGLPYMRPSIPSSSSPGAADEKEKADREKTAEADVLPVPAHVESGPEGDRERQDLLEQLRDCGIATEHAETVLIGHSRQKIHAAFAHLRIRLSRGERVPRPFSGFIFDFLRNPGRWEHELDCHGHWRPVIELRREEKQRKAANRTRDRPELSIAEERRRSAAIAWDQLDAVIQAGIRKTIETSYFHETPARRLQRCHEAALALKTTRNQPHDRDKNQAGQDRQTAQARA